MRIEDEQDGQGSGGWQLVQEASAQLSLMNATKAALTVQS